MKNAHVARAGLLAAGLLTVAACGAGGGYGGSNAATDASSGTSAKPGLGVASTSLGTVVVDSRGHTVYELTADQKGTSTCSTACLTEWPAVPSLKGKDAPASITAPVASTSAMSGMQMATVDGRPVYTFSQDQSAGDVNGEGLKDFGGTWWAVSPSGAPVKGTVSSSSGY